MPTELKHPVLNPTSNQSSLDLVGDDVMISIIEEKQHLYETKNERRFTRHQGDKIELYVGDDDTPVSEITKSFNEKIIYDVILDTIINGQTIQECIDVINKEFDDDLVYLGRSI